MDCRAMLELCYEAEIGVTLMQDHVILTGPPAAVKEFGRMLRPMRAEFSRYALAEYLKAEKETKALLARAAS